jgi:hypothetical protein
VEINQEVSLARVIDGSALGVEASNNPLGLTHSHHDVAIKRAADHSYLAK